MIRVNIYKATGPNPMDWKLVQRNKVFKNIQRAENFCKYIAEDIYGLGSYTFIITK